MTLHQYFEKDDGSLPEVIVTFRCADQVRAGFARLFAYGAKDITQGGARLWMGAEKVERTFETIDDAELTMSGQAEPFHIVLGSINVSGIPLPALGIFVSRNSLVIDYRMGSEWNASTVQAFIQLLAFLERTGGRVSVPWWGEVGERAFRQALAAEAASAAT
jgi:hypothetical protein